MNAQAPVGPAVEPADLLSSGSSRPESSARRTNAHPTRRGGYSKMNRRQFTGALAGIAAAQTARPAAKEDAHWFLVETFQLRQGDQVARMHDVLKGWLPKTPAGPKLVLEAVIAPHSPQLVAILGVANFEDIRTAQAAMTMAQTGLGMGEPPFDALNTTVLEATAYSPEIVIKKSETPRYFELRTYHSPTMAQLIALH